MNGFLIVHLSIDGTDDIVYGHNGGRIVIKNTSCNGLDTYCLPGTDVAMEIHSGMVFLVSIKWHGRHL